MSTNREISITQSTPTFFNQQYFKVDFAIISPMIKELEYLYETLSSVEFEYIKVDDRFEFKIFDYQGAKILIVHTGFGTAFASSAATLINEHFRPDYTIVCGTAGGLAKDVKINDVVIVEAAFEAEIHDACTQLKGTPFESCLFHPLKKENIPFQYTAHEELLSLCKDLNFGNTKVHTAKVVTSNAFPAPTQLMQKISDTNAYSIDMETSAFYQVAWLYKSKMIAIRGISNLVNHKGTDENVDTSDVQGASRAAGEIVLNLLHKLIRNKLTRKYDLAQQDLSYNDEAKELIERLKLQAHPEGGCFAQIYKSTEQVKSCDPKKYNGEARSCSTSIYYMLNKYDYSAWHKLDSDELWHFYSGSLVNIHTIGLDGKLSTIILGHIAQHKDAQFQAVIPAGTWFAAENLDKNNYSLVGCTVSPGFEYIDFKLAIRTELSQTYPQHKDIINKFTRMTNQLDIISDISPKQNNYKMSMN